MRGWCARAGDRQLDPRVKPGLEPLPSPVVRADLAAAAALASPHQLRAAARVQVGFGERERLADAQAGTPQHDDQAAQAAAVYTVAGVAHHGDDLLDRVGGRRGSASPCCAAACGRGTAAAWRVSGGGRRRRAAARTLTPPRASYDAPRLLLTSSGAHTPPNATAAQDATSLGRDHVARRQAKPQQVVWGDHRRRERPPAWIRAVSPSLPLFTDAGAARPPITRTRRLTPE